MIYSEALLGEYTYIGFKLLFRKMSDIWQTAVDIDTTTVIALLNKRDDEFAAQT